MIFFMLVSRGIWKCIFHNWFPTLTQRRSARDAALGSTFSRWLRRRSRRCHCGTVACVLSYSWWWRGWYWPHPTPSTKIRMVLHLVCWNVLIWVTITEISVKNSVWGPVEWVGDQLNGWGGSYQKQNSKKIHLVFWIFLIWATVTEISVKNGVWGPVEWLGDQLTGWGRATLDPN